MKLEPNKYTVYTNKDGRCRVYIKETKKVVSYPRILMEEKLGRPLEPDEDVHHKDGNPLNNTLDNLEVIKHGEHQKMHKPAPNPITVNCIWCNKEFTLNYIQQRNRRSNEKRGKKGSFCSRECSGKFGKNEQLSRNTMTECLSK